MGKNSLIWILFLGIVAVATALIPAHAWGLDKAADVVIVADTRHLHGMTRWWADLYNESHLLFALATMLTILVVGCTFGWLADIVMRRLGIDLTHRELAEK